MKTQTKKTFPYVTVTLIAVAVLVVAMLLLSLLNTLGVIGRLSTAVRLNNDRDYRISNNHLKVYEYHVAQNSLYQEYLYYAYGIMQDTYGITKIYTTPDAYINAMLPNAISRGTFSGQAYDYAAEYLVYAKGANDDSEFTFDDLDKNVDSYIKGLKDMASANGVSFGTYLTKWIGEGLNERDVREAMEIYYLATEYADVLYDRFSEAIENGELEDYRENNKATFYSAKYASYELMHEDMKDDIEACKTVDDVKVVIAKYLVDTKFDALYKTNVTDKNIADANIKTDAETETGDETETETEVETGASAVNDVAETETTVETEAETGDKETKPVTGKDATRQQVLETILAMNEVGDHKTKFFTSADKDDFKKACYAIVSAINTDVSAQYKKIKTTGSEAFVDLTDSTTASNASALKNWIFNSERKNGDVTVLSVEKTSTATTTGTTTETGEAEKEYTHTWYMVKEAMTYDTEKTKDAYFVKLTDDVKETGTNAETTTEPLKTADKKADEMLAELQANLKKSPEEILAQLKEIDEYKKLLEAGDVTEDDLKEYGTPGNFDYLATKYAKTTYSCLNEKISDGRSDDGKTVNDTDALHAWLYAAERKEGDVAKIKGSSTNNYYVVYFVEENEETWKMTARDTLANTKLDDWLKDKKTEFGLEANTEAATETSAS